MQASSTATTTLDVDAILERFGGARDVLRSGITAFLETWPEQLGLVREAIGQRDHDDLQRQAHGLKGAVGTFSSGRPLEILNEIESGAREGQDFETIRQRVETLESALDELRLELQNLIPTL